MVSSISNLAVNSNQYDNFSDDDISDDEISGFANTTKFPTRVSSDEISASRSSICIFHNFFRTIENM